MRQAPQEGPGEPDGLPMLAAVACPGRWSSSTEAVAYLDLQEQRVARAGRVEAGVNDGNPILAHAVSGDPDQHGRLPRGIDTCRSRCAWPDSSRLPWAIGMTLSAWPTALRPRLAGSQPEPATPMALVAGELGRKSGRRRQLDWQCRGPSRSTPGHCRGARSVEPGGCRLRMEQ